MACMLVLEPLLACPPAGRWSTPALPCRAAETLGQARREDP